MSVEFADGTSRTICSAPDWRFTTDGPLRFNSVLAGETYDARKELCSGNSLTWSMPGFDASAWRQARLAEPPRGKLQAILGTAVHARLGVRATSVTRVGEKWRFDLGHETTGWARVQFRGRPGQEITIEYPGAGSHTLGRYQTCKYVCAGETTETFESRFSYNGFQYVDVSGLDYSPAPSDVQEVLASTELESAGSFRCSDDRLNRLQDVLLRTVTNYIVHIPNDPTREKAGWTQDVETCFHPISYNFMAAPVWIKWQRDFLDAIQSNGYMPCVVPGRFDGPTINGPWWGGVVIYAPWFMYQFYGDRDLLEESYPAMQRHFDYLTSISRDGIVEWGLGDWMEVGAVRPVRTPVPFTSTAAYCWFASILEQTARILGRESDVVRYAGEVQRIRTAFNAKFLKPDTGVYALGSQTSQLLPLVLNLAPDDTRPAVLSSLLRRIEDDKYHLSTGFVGTPFLLTGLAELGHPEEAWRIATQTDYPSFIDAVLNHGKSVMKEDWKGGLVQMPTLQGPIGNWFFQSLAGIQFDSAEPGFRHVILRPETTGTLTWVTAKHETLLGTVTSAWKRTGNDLTWEVSIPPNVTADAWLPTPIPARAQESGVDVAMSSGVHVVSNERGHLHMKLGSGSYKFKAPAE